jgi:hypothetical protein
MDRNAKILFWQDEVNRYLAIGYSYEKAKEKANARYAEEQDEENDD